MKLGVIYCGYNQLSNIGNTLSFWNDLSIEGVDIDVSVVSVPFEEYLDIDHVEDGSTDYLKAIEKNNIKNIIFDPKYVPESKARGKSLEFLSGFNPDYIWQVDSDEYYTKDNVLNILSFLEKDKNLSYSVNFKNYIFDGNHYLDTFCVPKINRVTRTSLLGFVDDNRVFYKDVGVIEATPIPKEVAWVKHMTWLHEYGKDKVAYQLKHFGDCSYKWNESLSQLEIDLDYYARHGYQVPTVIREVK